MVAHNIELRIKGQILARNFTAMMRSVDDLLICLQTQSTNDKVNYLIDLLKFAMQQLLLREMSFLLYRLELFPDSPRFAPNLLLIFVELLAENGWDKLDPLDLKEVAAIIMQIKRVCNGSEIEALKVAINERFPLSLIGAISGNGDENDSAMACQKFFEIPRNHNAPIEPSDYYPPNPAPRLG